MLILLASEGCKSVENKVYVGVFSSELTRLARLDVSGSVKERI